VPSLTSQRDRDVLRTFARRIDPSDAGAHNNLGVLYYRKGLHEEAVDAFTRALELDPKMQVAQRNLEVAYLGTGYYERRAGELHERLRAEPADRAARWELGRACALLGKRPEAISQFTELLRHHPDDLGALIQLGLAEKAGGDLEKAQAWFERALALDPESSVVHLYIGEVLYNRGLNDDALAALERAIERNADNPDAHYLMGFVLGDLGRHEEAKAAARRAIKLNPTLSRAQANLSLEPLTTDRVAVAPGDGQLAHFNLGLAFRQQGYYVEALREYQVALDRGEARDLVLQAMAEVHLLRKDVAAAVSAYDLLLVTNRSSPKLWNERGVALHLEGRYAPAAESYGQALAVDSRYAIAHNNLGVARYHAGDVGASADAFRAALDAAPTFDKARLNFALLLFRGKRLQDSLEAYRIVLQHDPQDAVAWNGIGLVLTELRKFEDARNAFARAVQSRPAFAEAHYNLSFAFSNLGDFDSALRETKRALELDAYYVPQKFELAIDLQHESPDLSMVPELGGVRRADSPIEAFAFDSAVLDSLFTTLAPGQSEPNGGPSSASAKAGAEANPYAMALDYLTKGLHEQAGASVSRALARGANAAEGLGLLGDIFSLQGFHGEALERYRQARRAGDDSPRARMREARALITLGRGADARPLAEEVFAAAPRDVEALVLVAHARADTGDTKGALTALQEARNVAPDRADVCHRLGDAYRTLGHSALSIVAYRDALALDAHLAVVRYELARLLVAAGRTAEAEAELVTALDSVPTYADAALELAALWRAGSRPLDALRLLVEVLERDPSLPPALLALGELLLEMGRQQDAARVVGRLRRVDPDHAGALYYEGALLASQHRYRDAIARWERVLATDPAGPFGRRARRERRTALDLSHIFVTRLGRGL